jgi:Spy/CpxP family protein refolding chaperone
MRKVSLRVIPSADGIVSTVQKEFQINGMKTLLRMVPLVAVAASIVSAQTSTAPTTAEIVAARVARLTKLLTLSTAQDTQATAIFTTEVNALAPIKTSLATARTAIVTAVEANNAAGITAAANSIGTLTTQQEQVEGTAEAAFYVILTADQKTKYQELLAAGLDSVGNFHSKGGHH